MPTLHHDRRRVRRVLNPPAREVNARTGTSLRENMIFDPSLITFYEDKKKLRTGNISAGFFRDTQRLHVWAPFTNLSVLINTDWSLIYRFFF